MGSKFQRGIVRSEGYKGEIASGNGGMKNKRKKKVAQARFEARMEKIRREREIEAAQEAWLEEWGED